MLARSGLSFRLVSILSLSTVLALAAEPPEKALKYHEALLKRPHNASLFDRFFGAWLDEQPVETLGEYLKARAEKNGGQDWTVLALFEMRQGREEAALTALGKAIEALPDEPALAMDRAKLRMRRLEFEAARADLAKVISGKDEALSREAAKLTGRAWLREGKSAEAIKAWDAVLAAHPDDEDLLEDLVEAAMAESEINQALVYVDKLIGVSRDPYQKTLRMLRRGDLLSNAGRNDEAVEAYSAALVQVGEGSWLEREVLGQIEKVYRKQDRLDDLSLQLKKLAEAYPQRLLVQRQLAKLEAGQGEIDTAVGRFREVLKRSPGERELREEFVRLLSDGERFDEAVAEIGKLIELAPTEAGLHLQIAALRARQSKKDEVLAALGKAHDLLGRDEANGIRIAGLMLQYGLNEQGEALLNQLGSAAGAGPSAMEALAAHYARTTRRTEALDLLKKLSASGDLELLLRTSAAMAALGDNATAYERLLSRAEGFGAEPRFVTALGQAAMAAGKAGEVVPQMLKLVRQAKQSGEISDSVSLALRVIKAGEKSDEQLSSLTAQASRTPGEVCLLAALLDGRNDYAGVAKLLDPQIDPQVIHFHAALLDRRGEFEQAIAVMMKLASTEEGRKAGYFKDLSALQQRAGKTSEALATVEKWKQNAPGDKAAWITGSQLLRQSGKPDEAVKVTRQAVARFEGDVDLSASLASLHDEAGQWADAEAIYWRLYDEAQSPSDQARWAAQLARVAQRTGKTTELEEKFRERARGNRKSIGPVLAQAELARLLDNEDKRRDLLLEAVRLQPKDVDLRLQIATLEEQAGNPERVVAMLEEALPNDVNGRLRSALAQAYLRQGQTMKGMRELLSLAGKGGSDPRAVEGSVAALIQSGSYDDAIRYHREVLPDGGDWRSRYLLAVLLEKDGREAEAQPIFLSLLTAEGEIASLAKSATKSGSVERYPMEVRGIVQLINAVQSAYPRNPGGRLNNPSAKQFAIGLPDTVDEVRQSATVHLCRLARRNGAARQEGILPQIKAAGVADADFVMSLVETLQEEELDFKALLERFPEAPGLFELAVMYSRQPLEKPLITRLLKDEAKLSPNARFQARLRLAEGEPADSPAWTSLLETISSVCSSKEQSVRVSAAMNLVQKLDGTAIPEAHRTSIKQAILKVFADVTPQDGMPMEYLSYYRIIAVAAAGTLPDWIDATNSILRLSHADSSGNRMGSSSGTLQEESYEIADFEDWPFQSVSSWLLEQLDSDGGNDEPTPAENGMLAGLFKARDKIESPFLRAWLAVRVNDPAAIRETLSVTPKAEEATDFQLLKASLALKEKKPVDAYSILDQIRLAGSSDPGFNEWLLATLLAVAAEIPEKDRTPLAESVKAILLQARPLAGPKGTQALAAQALKLGQTELSTRIAPVASTTPSTGNRNRISGRFTGGSSGGNSSSPLERLTKLVLEKKHDAAAVEALRLLKAGRGSSRYSNDSPSRVIEVLAAEDRTALLKLVEPGDSKSLIKRLDYVDVCLDMNRKDLALAALESLYAERPEDPEIACRLAFNLPQDKKDQQRQLMTRAAGSREFAAFAAAAAEALENSDDANGYVAFFDSITGWLETTDPARIPGANLGWIGYYAREFYGHHYSMDFPPLMMGTFSTRNQSLSNKRTDIAKRLALAMMKHPGVAEEGFRLLSAARTWRYEPLELDAQARRALLASADRLNRQAQLFSAGSGGFRYSSGSSPLDEFSTLSWMASRLSAVTDPTDILPPAYMEELRLANPGLAKLIHSLAGLKQVSELDSVLVACDSTEGVPPVMIDSLKSALILRGAAMAGAAAHFLGQLRKLPASLSDESENGLALLMMRGAIVAGLRGKAADLEAVCSELGAILFGAPTVNWTKPADVMKLRFGINAMEVLTESGFDAVSAARLRRALFRLGLPVGDSEDDGMSVFQSHPLNSAEEAERFFEEIGWLTEASDWSPFGVHFVEMDSNGKDVTFTPQTQLQVEQVLGFLRLDPFRKSLIQRLKERKSGRFGALMTAAALSEGNDRQTLTGQAIREAGASLAKVPKARIAEWSLISSWIPRDAIASLPAASRELLAGPEERDFKKSLAEAEALLAKPDIGVDGEYLFDSLNPLIQKIARRDLDKAVSIFIAADRLFTAGLLKGGDLCLSAADDFKLTCRDQALIDLVDDSDSLLTSDPNLGFRFLNKLMNSPDGGRFAYVAESSSFSSPDLLTSLGNNLYNQARGSGSDLMQQYERLMPMIQSMDEGARELASIGTFAYFSKPWNDFDAELAVRQRKKIEELRRNHPEIARFAVVPAGVISYPNETPEDRAMTSEALNKILKDPFLQDYPKLAFGISNATRRFQLLYDATTLEALAGLYADYCRQERSAVNYTSSCLFRDIGLCSLPLSRRPLVKRIHEAFWTNARRTQPGGHPEIPDTMKPGLLAVSAFCDDEETTRRLFEECGQDLVGDIRAIVPLLLAREFALVDRLLPNDSQSFIYAPWWYYYNSEIEEALKEYAPRITDPVKRLRLENALCGLTNVTGPLAPRESADEQIKRLAAMAKTHFPKSPVSQFQVLSRLLLADPLVALEFEDRAIEWSRARSFQTTVNDWVSNRRPPGVTMNSNDFFMLQYIIHYRAALRAMGNGDVSLLKSMVDVLKIANPGGNASTRTQVNAVTNLTYQTLVQLPMMVSQDRTKGFAEALPIYCDLAQYAATTKLALTPETFPRVMTTCRFLAEWTGHPEIYQELLKKLPANRQAEAAKFPASQVLGKLPSQADAALDWIKKDTLAPLRKDYLTRILSKKELSALLPADGSWIKPLQANFPEGEFASLTKTVSPDWIPEVRTALSGTKPE
jgi:tetratricopeptide (TPR) repeat protein